jgi:hypothetical protein
MKRLTPTLDEAFQKLYFAGDWSSIAPAARVFFDSPSATRDACDNFFENFTPKWRPLFDRQNYAAAEEIWEKALRPAIDWEAANPERFLHKGTAFYFWAATALRRGDFDRGYLLMHQGLEEDKRNWGPDITPTKPGFALVSIDAANLNQWFRPWVIAQANFLSTLLNDYSDLYKRSLDFKGFRTKFLSSAKNLDTLFLFAHSVARLMQIMKAPSYTRQNPFAGQLGANVLFDIALVIDAAIKGKNAAGKLFSEHAGALLTAAGSTITVGHLTNHIQSALTTNFDSTLHGIVSGSFKLPGGVSLSPFERDVVLSYGIRNRGAHDVSSSAVIWQQFEEIERSLFNVLFGAVDYLY